MSAERTVRDSEGMGRRQVSVAPEGLEWSSRGEGKDGVGKYRQGVAEDMQECMGILVVRSGQLGLGLGLRVGVFCLRSHQHWGAHIRAFLMPRRRTCIRASPTGGPMGQASSGCLTLSSL